MYLYIFLFLIFFPVKIRQITCESYARQMIHVKCQIKSITVALGKKEHIKE